MNNKKLIYVVDDEPHICTMIQIFLESEGFQVQTFCSSQKLLTALYIKIPDMIILDIMMPGKDGLTLCQQIRKELNVPILFVSAKGTADDRILGIEKGGDDYLVKPFVPLELIVRVKALFRRAEFSQTDQNITDTYPILTCGNMKIIPSSKQITIAETPMVVTPLEFDFLLYLCQRKETAVAKQELLTNVWKFPHGEEDSQAMESLIKRLRKKMQSIHTTMRIESVWGYGYRMTELEGS